MKSILYLLKHQTILFLLFVFVFIMGDNVTHTLSIHHQATRFLIIVVSLFSIEKIVNRGFYLCPEGKNLLIFLFVYWIFKICTDHSPGAVALGITLYVPILVYMVFISRVHQRDVIHFKKTLYLVYVIECCMAIVERFILHSTIFVSTFQKVGDTNIMTSQLSIEDIMSFRAIAIYGHPLQNALIVFVFILFILVYEEKIKKKIYLVTLGVLAIFCFNARAAILISIISSCLYVIHLFVDKSYNVNTKLNLFVGFTIILILLYALFLFGIVGGRLQMMGVFDDSSAATRIKLLRIFDYYDWKNFIFGIDWYQLQNLIWKIDVFAVEIFWFNIGLSYGIVCVIGLIFFYTRLIKAIMRNESTFNKLFLSVPYILLASTNLSLSVDIVSMTAYFMLSYVMPRQNRKLSIYAKKSSSSIASCK